MADRLNMSWMFLLMLGGLLQMLMSKRSSEDVYCSIVALSWIHGMEACQRINASLVIDEDLLYNNIVSDNVTIWTSNYARRAFMTKSQHKLCGFTYIDSSIGSWSGDILFGNCDSNKSYICRETNNTGWMIYKGSYQQATECGREHISIFTYLNNTDTNITGYFWINKVLHQWEFILGGDVRFIFLPSLCGMYNSNAGHYYGNCYKKFKTLCKLGKRHPDFNRECLNSFSGQEATSMYPQIGCHDNEVISRIETSASPLNSNITNITSDIEQQLHQEDTNSIDLKTGVLGIIGVIVALCVILGLGFMYLTIRYRRTFSHNRDLSSQTRTRDLRRFISSVIYVLITLKSTPKKKCVLQGPEHRETIEKSPLA